MSSKNRGQGPKQNSQGNQQRNAAPQTPATPKITLSLRKNEVIDKVNNTLTLEIFGVVAEGNSTKHSHKINILDGTGNLIGTRNTSLVRSDGTFSYEEVYALGQEVQVIARTFKVVNYNIGERVETIVPALPANFVPAPVIPAKPKAKIITITLEPVRLGIIDAKFRALDQNDNGVVCTVLINFMGQRFSLKTNSEGCCTLRLPYIKEGTNAWLQACTSGIAEEFSINVCRPVAAQEKSRSTRNLILVVMCVILWIACPCIGSGDASIHIANQPTGETWEHSRWAIALIFSVITFVILCLPTPRRAPLEKHTVCGRSSQTV